MLKSSIIISVALFLRSVYDFTIYGVYHEFTQEQSKYFDLVLMILCQVLPLGAGALSMLFSLRHSRTANTLGLNSSLSQEINPSHRDSYQSSKKYAHEIASRLINLQSVVTEQEQVQSVRMQNPASPSMGKGTYDRLNVPFSQP